MREQVFGCVHRFRTLDSSVCRGIGKRLYMRRPCIQLSACLHWSHWGTLAGHVSSLQECAGSGKVTILLTVRLTACMAT